MRSIISKLFMAFFACMTILFMSNIYVFAENANVSISSGEGSVGDTIPIEVKVKPEVDANARIWISYDTNLIEYVSGGKSGVAGMVSGDFPEIKANEEGKLTFNFKLKAVGQTELKIAQTSEVKKKEDGAILNITAANGKTNAKEAAAISNDSTLSGLIVQAVSSNGDKTTVSYSPNFSPDVHEYKADLSSDTIDLVVATTLSDPNATTQVSGTRIDPGNNKTTIKVKAQDGSTTEYILYTTRASETTPPETVEGGSEAQTTDINRAPKELKSMGMYLIQDFSLITVPEGFAEATAGMNGETIAVLKGTKKELTLVCLSPNIEGTDAKLCIYNEASGAIDTMVDITSKQRLYTIIPTDSGYAGPEGYTQTTIDVNGEKVKAWTKAADSEFVIVYAMNSEGEKALYVYDKKEGTMQRFFEGNKSQNPSDEPPAENKEYLAMKREYDTLAEEYRKDHAKKNRTIIALGLLLIVVVAYNIYRVRKAVRNSDNDDSNGINYKLLDEDNEKSEKINNIVKEELDVKEEEINEKEAANVKEEVKTSTLNAVKTDTAKPEKSKSEEKKVTGTKKETDSEAILIDMEEDEPFEIEFVDLEDNNK